MPRRAGRTVPVATWGVIGSALPMDLMTETGACGAIVMGIVDERALIVGTRTMASLAVNLPREPP